ncbi:hypothetical protein GCM10009122_39390 [Fulvivirga kasyanovii]|uniref:Tetratricopeptide repeat protein n=1 Tax=Fulvivirga kasyanovii TaxID=396812 RepID=A0ABW9RIH0_9BACT|nr:hypothetical protein [Fulvivirga kasyanovii]MTI23858.1 hypothetical protein [Fulvivirga kasyanovii]
MNKQRFIKILQDYHNIPGEDRNKLHELAKNYPYSQIIHTLVAKANHDAKTDIAEQTLHYAAFYATDRHILKEVIQERPSALVSTPAEVHEPIAESTPVATEAASQHYITVAPEAYDQSSDQIRDAVLSDLESLKKSKASYMQWLEEDTPPAKVKKEPAKAKKASKSVEKEKKSPVKKSQSNVKPKVKESKTSAKEVKTTAEKKKEKTPKTKKDKVEKEPDAAVSTQPKGRKPKKIAHDEQKAIIENFISKEPSITAKPLKSSDNQPDLSEASTSFNEDLVSENLAQILVNQGKKSKAIDIYKKLIWKFPQKKAYFASRIEELQK